MKLFARFTQFTLVLGLALIGFEVSAAVYVIQEKQKERYDTRWTLTDWLHTKERMKMMDTWAAIFSDPKKAKFSPEISFSYSLPLYDSKLQLGSTAYTYTTKNDPLSVHYDLNSNIYLTNLVSGTVGIRTLNIDLGVNAYYQKLDREELGAGPLLRIFGNSVQDSSLELGFIYSRRDILIPASMGAGDPAVGLNQDWVGRFQGWHYRAALTFYVFKFLGVEGIGRYFPNLPSSTIATRTWSGYSYSAAGFLEISFIRLSYGYFKEQSAYNTEVGKIADTREGFFAKAAMYF